MSNLSVVDYAAEDRERERFDIAKMAMQALVSTGGISLAGAGVSILVDTSFSIAEAMLDKRQQLLDQQDPNE